MKLVELMSSADIFTTNEEQELLDSIDAPCFYESFQPRQQFIIDNLVRKSLISKVRRGTGTVVVKNEF